MNNNLEIVLAYPKAIKNYKYDSESDEDAEEFPSFIGGVPVILFLMTPAIFSIAFILLGLVK